MIKPKKHGNKWRIRPYDILGKRHSFIFDKYSDVVEHGIKFQAEQLQFKSGEKSIRIEPKMQ